MRRTLLYLAQAAIHEKLFLHPSKAAWLMSKFTDYIGSRFGNPRGFVGKVCCRFIRQQVDFENHQVKDIVKDKSFVVIYTKT